MDKSVEEKDVISSENLKKYVNQLEKRIYKNQQDRITHPNDPERWVKSEVDLEEHISLFRDLSTMPELYDEFLNLGGLKFLSELLSHPNIDIFISSINVLAELLDPEIIYTLKNHEAIIAEIEALKIQNLCINSLFKIDEDHDEIDYQGVKSSFELLENLIELTPNILEEMSINSEFLLFLVKRMNNRKTMEYDANRIHASEILSILLHGSEDSLEIFGKKDVIDGIDKLLRIIAIYRKRDPDSIEEEELVENAFQCLCRLMLISSNQIRFGKIQGVELAIRLVRQRRQTYRLALKLLDYSLLDSPENCTTFVQLTGLKCIFSVLMRKGVTTKIGSDQEREDDEHVISVIQSLCSNCTGIELARVMNKFVEHKHEKLERLIEMHEKYVDISKTMLKSVGNSKDHAGSLYNALNMNEGEQNYLNKYEAGLSTCQLIDCVLIRIYNMGNKNLSLCLLLLLHNKGVKIQDIYNNVSDYLDHLSEEAKDTKDHVEGLLKNFLVGASDTGMFS